jgi:hypothetical protein
MYLLKIPILNKRYSAAGRKRGLKGCKEEAEKSREGAESRRHRRRKKGQKTTKANCESDER